MAGCAMNRRSQFQFGSLLPLGPRGQIDAGLGKGTARGTVSLVKPNWIIERDVETHVIDGVEIIFQLALETEAPAEMHQFYPDLNMLNLAENACRHIHNFLPIRGSVVRDPRVSGRAHYLSGCSLDGLMLCEWDCCIPQIWSQKLNEAIDLFGSATNVLIGQHHWPTWTNAAVNKFISNQRDLYKFVHDQTVRLMNLGFKQQVWHCHSGAKRPVANEHAQSYLFVHANCAQEIADTIQLPPSLSNEWYVLTVASKLSQPLLQFDSTVLAGI
eukprot:COSAG01_NODE_3398_length_6144_cov_24.119438_4_plen_271_part_00